MEAYALSQGITESWQSMSQAEKVMLRYNYLMSVTSAQQNDFQRTQASFANQTRLLTLNIQQLAATIGQGLIAAVLPAVTALNKLFAVLQKAAIAVRNFFYVLTGYKPQIGGGIPKDLSDAGDSAAQLQSAGSGAANSLDGASKSAKKLKKNLSVLPFDQLNQLSDNTKSLSLGESGGSGGGAGGGGLDTGGLGDMDTIFDSLAKSDVETPVNEWATRLRNAFLNHDWDKLGEEIAWGINKGLQFLYDAISWENVGPKITPFINAFTQTFNSLVDNIEWDLMGRTIGAGVNTIVNSLNLLIEGVDFKNLGTKISEGIRGAISEIQWTSLGNLLGNYFMVSWDILSGVISGLAQTGMAGLTGFEELGASIGSALNGIFQKINFGEIGKTISTGLNGVFDAIRAFTITVDWNGLAENISNGINNMIHGVNWSENGATLSRFVRDMLGTIKDVAKEVDWEGLGKGIGDFLAEIDWVGILTDVGTIIYEAASGMISGLFDSDSGTVFKLITTFFVASKFVGIGTKFGNAISEAMTGKTITSNLLSKIGGWFSTSIIPKILPEASSIVTSVGTWITGTFAPAVASAFSAVAGALFSPVGLIVVGAIIGGFLIWKNWDKITEFAGNVKEAVVDAFNSAKDWLKEKGENLIEGLKNGWNAVKDSKFLKDVSKIKDEVFNKIGDVKSKVVQKGKDIIQGLKNGYQSIKNGEFLDVVKKIKDETFDKIGDIKTKVTDKGKNIIQGLKNGYNSIKNSEFLSTVKNIRQEVFDEIGDIRRKVADKGKNIVQGLKDGLDNKWPGFTDTLRGLSGKIEKSIGNLSGLGRRIMNGFARGISSIDIKLPHITWDWTTIGAGKFSIKIPSNFGVKWYAKGGFFDSPSIIGVGEAGREAVLPLENKRTMKMIANSIVDNSDGFGGLTADEIKQAVAQGVAMAMMNNQNNQPVTVYAELKTENDEVLARAVARGQHKLDYRFNPTPQIG